MTKIKGNKTFCDPFKRYGADSPVESITYRDNEHTPYAKRAGSIDRSIVIFQATRNANGDYFGFHAEEITTSHNGRTAGRVISVDVPLDQAEKLARFILEAVEMHRIFNGGMTINTGSK